MVNRLELNWIGKYENKISPEPRIMYENAEYSYAKEQTGQIGIEEVSKPTYGNLLMHGDNLLALKAIESEYAGRIKCCWCIIFTNP